MNAWVLHGVDDIRFESVKEPFLAENEVLVAVKAVGICGSDIPRIYRTGAHRHPLIPGHEFSGQIVKVRGKAGESWLGRRVGVFPLIPCKKCVCCQERRYELCRDYDYLGSRRDGGFAEYVSVPEENLIELPEGVSYEAAAMLEPMAVAAHAMRRAAPQAVDTLAVCGLGTIGLILLMFLLEAKNSAGVADASYTGRILVIGNKDFQKQNALRLGIPEEDYCDSRRQDAKRWLMEHTGGMGADVFFECVGKNDTCTLAIDCAAPSGRVMLVGNPYSDMHFEKSVYWKILRNQLTVMGTWNSSFMHTSADDWNYVLERLAEKKIAPEELISHRFSLEELEEGFHIMRDKTEDYVKIMGVF